MFGIIDSKGKCFLKADDSHMSLFVEAGSSQHSRMPYYSITDQLFTDHEALLNLAQTSIKASKDK